MPAELDESQRRVVADIAQERMLLERRQNRLRVAFIAFVLVFVYAQSYQGRVFLHDNLIHKCAVDNGDIRRALHVKPLDCKRVFPAPSPFPWR